MTSSAGTPAVRERKVSGCLVIVTVVLAAFLALVALLIFPVSLRLTAPVLCEADERSVVTTSESTNHKGEQTMTSRLYCVDAAARAFPQRTFHAYLVLFAEAFFALFFLFVVRVLLERVGRRRRET